MAAAPPPQPPPVAVDDFYDDDISSPPPRPIPSVPPPSLVPAHATLTAGLRLGGRRAGDRRGLRSGVGLRLLLSPCPSPRAGASSAAAAAPGALGDSPASPATSGGGRRGAAVDARPLRRLLHQEAAGEREARALALATGDGGGRGALRRRCGTARCPSGRGVLAAGGREGRGGPLRRVLHQEAAGEGEGCAGGTGWWPEAPCGPH
ncbi:hypothetical protein PVAP13_8NG069801 [Panicum virgatum]|uniref:Uncharacterized protein n=1 Tax=Panicum virgatum TaxID=38727 RepID=A0A8T0P3B7_PANVG|nr:hypothetical protein PVAP13_8NG069801 [Panicum virgatum]